MSVKLLARRQLRYLARTPAACTATVMAMALGVASMVAVHLVSERIRDQIDRNALLAGYTHAIRGGGITADDYFDLRDIWRRGGGAPIEAMVPVIEGHASVDGAPTRIVGIDLLAARPLAANADGAAWSPQPTSGLLELLRGRAALASDAVGLDTGAVARLGTAPTLTPIDIVGTFPARERRLVVDIALAQELLGRDTLTAVWIRSQQGPSALDRWLPGSAVAFGAADGIDFGAGWRAQALDQAEPTRRFAQALTFNLGALGFLALFVAAFLIYQASYANVVRRGRDTERLLAIGVGPRTLRGLFVAEGIGLGALGGAIGVGAGWTLAGALIDSPLWSPEPVAFSDIAASKGMIGAIGVGALGAFAATARKGRRWAAPVAATLAALLLGVAATADTLAAAFAIILAMCALQIAAVTPAVAALARQRLFGAASPTARPKGQLVRRAALRDVANQLDELSVAVSALSIAIAAAIGVAVMVESFRRDFVALLDQTHLPGIHVEFTAPDAVDARTVAWLEELPGVAAVRRYGSADALVNGHPARMRLVPDDAREAARHGQRMPLGTGILVSEAGARAYGIEPGDTVALDGGQGQADARVAGLFREYGAAVPGIIAAARHWGDALAGARFATAVILPDAAMRGGDGWRATLAGTVQERFPTAVVRDDLTRKARALEVFDRSHALSERLTLIALVVAIAGLYTALSANAARRLGEERLLHTLGATRRRIGRLRVAQSTLLGVTAAVLAAPLGVAIAWALCELVNPRAFGWSITMVVPLATLAQPALLGVAAAALAGLAPAWRTMQALTAPSAFASS